MNCKCVFCRFQHVGKCYNKLSEIEIDERGLCSCFVPMEIDKTSFEKISAIPADKIKVYSFDIDKTTPPSK